MFVSLEILPQLTIWNHLHCQNTRMSDLLMSVGLIDSYT